MGQYCIARWRLPSSVSLPAGGRAGRPPGARSVGWTTLHAVHGGPVVLRPPVRTSTKTFFDFHEIWYVDRGRQVMHDGMQYDPIQGQGQEP